MSDIVLDADKTVDMVLPAVYIEGQSTDDAGNPVGDVYVGIDGESTLTSDGSRFSGYASNGLQYSVRSDSAGNFGFRAPAHNDYTIILNPSMNADFAVTKWRTSPSASMRSGISPC